MATLREIAREYLKRTTDFDRIHCTGKVIAGVPMPNGGKEYLASRKNALDVFYECKNKAVHAFFSPDDLRVAIYLERKSFFEELSL